MASWEQMQLLLPCARPWTPDGHKKVFETEGDVLKENFETNEKQKYSNIGTLGVCQANAKGSRPLFKSVKTPAQGLFNVNVKTPA